VIGRCFSTRPPDLPEQKRTKKKKCIQGCGFLGEKIASYFASMSGKILWEVTSLAM